MVLKNIIASLAPPLTKQLLLVFLLSVSNFAFLPFLAKPLNGLISTVVLIFYQVRYIQKCFSATAFLLTTTSSSVAPYLSGNKRSSATYKRGAASFIIKGRVFLRSAPQRRSTRHRRCRALNAPC